MMALVSIKASKKEQIRGLITHLIYQNTNMIQVIEIFVVNKSFIFFGKSTCKQD